MSEQASVDSPRNSRRLWAGISVVVIVVMLFVTLVILKPAMPDRILLLTGPEGSGYHDLGLRYAAELKLRGLETEVVVTAGGLDNLRRLAAGAEDTVALAPLLVEPKGGADVETSHFVALGSIGLEPLWLFYQSELDIERVTDLAGHAVVTGGRGTVSDRAARLLIEHNGIGGDVELRSSETPSAEAAIEWIDEGSAAAIFVTGTSDSSLISTLLGSEKVSLLSFDRAAAYAARIQGIASLTAPEGVFDLGRNIPSEEAHLLSAVTELVALDSLHPSVAPMVLSVAAAVRGNETRLATTAAFPSGENTTFPLASSARRYFEHGERGLSKFLPYKITRFVNHLGFVVLPLLTVAALLLKLVPLVLRSYGSMSLVGLLKRLEAVEKAHAGGSDRTALLGELDRIDEKSAKLFVPRSTVHDYIDFRQFLHDMRERVESGGSEGA